MNRRDLLALIGAAATLHPLPASAQQASPVRRVGVLIAQAETDPLAQSFAAAFSQALERLGWIEHRNVAIDCRFAAGDKARFGSLAAELVAAGPDVILASSTPGLNALRKQTSSIPLVFVLVSDPVAQGFVPSLAHPGGNITGFSTLNAPLMGKWLQLLKEAAPGVTRVVVVFDPDTSPAEWLREGIEAAAPSLDVAVTLAPVHDLADVEARIAAQAVQTDSGAIALPGGFTQSHRAEIVAIVNRHRLPLVGALVAEAGGLLSYYFDPVELYAEAASYVDRILRGARPADLPVQQPTKFELVVNLKTAKALGLEIPQSILARAGEVIE